MELQQAVELSKRVQNEIKKSVKGKDGGDGLTQKEGWCMIGNSKNRISPHS